VSAVLRELPTEGGARARRGRPRVVAAAAVVAALVGVTGVGVAPIPIGIALVVVAAVGYLVSLRLVLSQSSWSILGPALPPAACLLGAMALLQTGPGWPWTWLIPVWVWLMLSAWPWLDERAALGDLPAFESTVLSGLLVTLPVPYFVVALTPGLPAGLSALAVATGCLVPGWRMVCLSGLGARSAWERAAIVSSLMAVALVMVVRMQVASPLLLVAMVVGWYGLTGVASLRQRSELPSFAAYVILAAAILAISAPA
jgi:hypothetical protein